MTFNRAISFVFLLTTAVFIAFKIVVVPISHDEVSTIITASQSSLVEIMFYSNPSPNNHILNTILTKFSIFFFGHGHFAVRLPNLIAFFIYGIAAFRVTKTILGEKSTFFIPALLFFMSNLYFLDFFGLSRGYGLASSFCLLSISYLLSAFELKKNRQIFLSLIAAMLAAYASFTVLPFFIILFVLCCYYFIICDLKNKKRIMINVSYLFFISFVFGALIIIPIVRMSATNQFQYWSSTNFFEATIQQLIIHSIYDSKVLFFQVRNFIYAMIFLTLGVNIVYSIARIVKNKRSTSSYTHHVMIATLLLVGTGVIDLLQSYILGTPKLEGRTALFYFPLFIVGLVATSNIFKSLLNKSIAFLFSGLISITCILQLTLNAKPFSVREWSYDANTKKVIDYINSHLEKEQEKLDCNWIFQPSFFYYSEIHPIIDFELGGYNKNINSFSSARYYYIPENEYDLLKENYVPIIKFDNHCWLLERK
jgi:MFS family permease